MLSAMKIPWSTLRHECVSSHLQKMSGSGELDGHMAASTPHIGHEEKSIPLFKAVGWGGAGVVFNVSIMYFID